MGAREQIHRPWSQESEQAVLGALMLDPDAWWRVADCHLEAAHFFDSRHRAIWRAVADLNAHRQPVDQVTVLERLQVAGQAEECGGLPYLTELAQSVPSAAGVKRYAQTVIDKAARRALAQAAEQMLALVGESEDADQLLDRAAGLLSGIQRTKAAAEPRSISDLVAPRIERWQAMGAGEMTPGVPTGLEGIDSALGGGFKPGKVVVLAARPSVGKSSLAGQMALSVAAQGQSVLVLSLEMPAGELVDRCVANLGRVSMDALTTGRFHEEDWSRMAEAAEAMGRLPLFIDDQPALTLLDIRSKARQVKRRHGLALVVVDYLQLCSSTSTTDKRHHQIEQISRGLKQLAKELDVCVLALSQLNRSTEGGEPQLHHLKESGAVEEDADTVILLHPWAREADRALTVLAKVAKNRQGPRGRIALKLYGEYQLWAESSADVSTRARAAER